MIYDFLYDCKCAIPSEAADFQNALRKFVDKQTCVGFMPAVIADFYPIFTLSRTKAKQIISPDVYIIPIGATACCVAKPYFEKIVNNFYQDNELDERLVIIHFDIKLEEMLLLHNPGLNCSFSFYDGTEYNVILCRITLPDGTANDLIVVPNSPDDCWNRVVEPYGIKCDIVIDSHKGMGNWFDQTPLYDIMRKTKAIELLPHYYFKGLYVSHDVPPGFDLLYTIPDDTHHQGFADLHFPREIYEIDWDKNKRSSLPL